MRINAFLARAGIASRRKADELIKKGVVKINDQQAQLNSTVNETDDVEVYGKKVSAQTLRYIMLHKPIGYMSTLSDPEGRRKVTDLIDIKERVVPVGRLDFNTSGLLILTNDGTMARNLMHPSSNVEKTYEITIDDDISNEILNKLSNGIELEDGKTAKAKATQASKNVIHLTIKEGRNRQVRRMIKATDLRLRKLKRIKYSNLDLSGLAPGEWRDLNAREVLALKKMVQ